MSLHPSETEAAGARRKAARRLLPFLMLCYFCAYLDRVNVSFAALTMNRDLGLSASAYGFGAGLFFLGYVAFEVPSNLILERVGARRWIARIMVTWSLISGSTAFAAGEASFYALRLALGLAEAGFFPGIILYLTFWFPARERARIVGTFMVAVPLSAALGGPVSGLILTAADGMLGMAGWQWLYLIEAAPSLVLGLCALRVLTDRPAEAEWLTPSERTALAARLAADPLPVQAERSLAAALLQPRLIGLALVYFGLSTGLYAVGMWLPQIVSGFGLGALATGFVSALPYCAAACVMVPWTRRSDRTGERAWHTGGPAIAAGLALAVASQASAPLVSILALSACAMGVFAAIPTFWTLPTALLGGRAAAGGIALVNAIGGIGGFVGPSLMGWIKDATGRFDHALAAVGLLLVLTGLLAARLGRGIGRSAIRSRPIARKRVVRQEDLREGTG